MGDDPQADNYDRQHRLIRSMFNGSKGPLLRRATGLDWAGDPIKVEGRFKPRHGERNYEEMVAHFKDYNDIVGDHPSNLQATSLALNAYMLTGDKKYRDWILEYAGAWKKRMEDNGGIIPSKIGLDGKIGGPDGKWYGGVYGWGFTVVVPQDGSLAHRNNHYLALAGFGNAFLLTGDDVWLGPWRKMIDLINAQGKMIKGVMHYPRMHGDQGWYAFSPEKYKHGAEDIWYWSMRAEDRKRLPDAGWISFLEGKDAGFPERTLRNDLETIRRKMAAMKKDETTPNTRLADDAFEYNPASAGNLVRLMLGGIHHFNRTLVLHCRLRYFDPERRRAGLPQDVAALVEKLSTDSTTVTLVNLDQVHPRTVIVQAGGYGEHEFTSVEMNGQKQEAKGKHLTVRLEPGAGARLVLGMRRYGQQPHFAQYWN
jgi:hypothetical protein